MIPAVPPCVSAGRVHVVYRLARQRSHAGLLNDVVDRPATVVDALDSAHDGVVILTCWRVAGTKADGDRDGMASQHTAEHDPSGQIPGTWRWGNDVPVVQA